MPEGEEKEKEIENILEKIMKKNTLTWQRKLTYKSIKHRESLTSWTQRGPLQRHIIIKKQKVKDKERILKAAREKQRVTCKGVPIRISTGLSKETL